jgi:hypothetical protein
MEHAFGVLQSRWAIVCHLMRTWNIELMWVVMTACVIIHNMIVDDEHDKSIHDQGGNFRVSWLPRI